MTICVRDFRPGDESAFYDINREWIEHFFVLEAKDIEMLGDPRTHILDRGGAILIAEEAGVAIGVVALSPMTEDCVELAKMGVRPLEQGKGAGWLLVEAALAKARDMGMSRVYLETNSRLAPALSLYERAGFRPVQDPHPSPYARADVQLELFI